MTAKKNAILTINGGSSSIKIAVYSVEASLVLSLSAEAKKIGLPGAVFTIHNNSLPAGNDEINLEGKSYAEVSEFTVKWIEQQPFFNSIQVIGHRIVHGMHHAGPAIISNELLQELKEISPFDPEHLPGEIKLIELFRDAFPKLQQVACFDTSFHATMPAVAKLLPVPLKYRSLGVERYGFHGLSYTYLIGELERTAGKEVASGKVIIAHLGSGSSIAAIANGKSIDTSMGFTPTGGLPMSSRTGDLDPGVILYLLQKEKLTVNQLSRLVNHESGLLGISETTGDMEQLIKSEATDKRAAAAVDFYCYQTKKWIGSFAAALGGVDTLIFSGGIGEHSAEVRRKICQNLSFLGIELDEERNKQNAEIISADSGKVTVRVIATNEEWMMASLICDVMNYKIKT